jgi:hypothetical protein
MLKVTVEGPSGGVPSGVERHGEPEREPGGGFDDRILSRIEVVQLS